MTEKTVYVDEGWWHPNVKSGQVHDHKPNMPMTMHRLCEPVYTKRLVTENPCAELPTPSLGPGEKRPTNWFEALGKPVSQEGRVAALKLLVENGYDEAESAVLVNLVAREVEHDEPNLAQRHMRLYLGPMGTETLAIMVFAHLCCPPA